MVKIKKVIPDTYAYDCGIKENDILISIAGTLGRVSVLRKEHLPCNMNQAISFVRLFNNHLNNKMHTIIDILKVLINKK